MKKLIKPILKLVGVLLLLLMIFFGFLIYKGAGITIGRCLIAQNGSYMLIDENSPIVMSSDRPNMFKNLSTGDKILVIHSGINESYPGSTGAYACIKLGNGDILDIPSQVIRELTEMGWLKKSTPSFESNVKPIEFQAGPRQLKIYLPDNWEYNYFFSEDSKEEGISFWPKDSVKNKIAITYYPLFGVCGTGLQQEDIRLGVYDARLGKYDNMEQWSFIHFKEPHENYVILNESEEAWSDELESQLQWILKSIEFPNLVMELN